MVAAGMGLQMTLDAGHTDPQNVDGDAEHDVGDPEDEQEELRIVEAHRERSSM
jgi:hypothetical protein